MGENAHLSNQLPITLLDLMPPSWMPSLRQRSVPLNMERVVQRISPSRVVRTVPVDAHVLSAACVDTSI